MSIDKSNSQKSFDGQWQDTKNKTPKRINQRATAIESYKEAKKSGLIKSQEKYITEVLKQSDEPFTCKGLRNETGLEVSSLTRTIYNLRSKGIVYAVKEAKSDFSNRTVEWYGLVGKIYNEEKEGSDD